MNQEPVILIKLNGCWMHPGWLRTEPYTPADYDRVKRDHPEWFPDDARPFRRLAA